MQLNRLRIILVGVVAVLIGFSMGTTTAQAAVYTYDTLAISRVDVPAADAVEAGPRHFGGEREESASPSAQPPGASMTLFARSVATEAGTTRVGRWMGEGEFDTMSSSGRVVEGAGGRTFVVEPPNPAAYPSAKPGSVYAEFDVPTASLKPAGKPEWSVIPGPNAGTTRFGPLPSEMPSATNICLVCRK